MYHAMRNEEWSDEDSHSLAVDSHSALNYCTEYCLCLTGLVTLGTGQSGFSVSGRSGRPEGSSSQRRAVGATLDPSKRAGDMTF